MVSCGDDADTTVKLWNLAQIRNEASASTSSPAEPFYKIETAQVKHYSMAYSHQFDYFAVCAWTPDIKILRIIKE